MSSNQPQREKAILNADGELHDSDMVGQQSTLYCIHCGTVNRAEARFCRSCGQSLDDQSVDHEPSHSYLPPELKAKRTLAQPDEHFQRGPMSAPAMAFSAIRLLFVSGLVIAVYAIGDHAIVLPICILVAWFMVEGFLSGAIH
jgi:hypothetical protein